MKVANNFIQSPKVHSHFTESSWILVFKSPTARTLAVILDSILSFVQSCFYQLRSISKIRSFLLQTDLEKVIHAFISSWLDYCNILYSGLSKKAISRLQLVQNAAAWLLTNTRRQENVSPVLTSLQWLPVSFRIDFKILLITFKAPS